MTFRPPDHFTDPVPDLPPDPLDAVPPPHVVRRRLAELVEATTFTRRLLRLSEKLHRRTPPAGAAPVGPDAEGATARPLRLAGGVDDADATEGGRA